MKELIKAAKEKGFYEWIELLYISDVDGMIYYHEPNNDERCFYLWMCELQKWLRDEKDILLLYDFRTEDMKKKYVFFTAMDGIKATPIFDTYEESLQSGLIEALKLI